MSKFNLYVITGPSGSGKTSLVSALVERTPNLAVGISYTTRKPRKGETEGVHYYFVDDEGFNKLQMDFFARTKYHNNKYNCGFWSRVCSVQNNL